MIIEIQIKYNMANKVKFHPFDKKELKPITGQIISYQIDVDMRNNVNIVYNIIDNKYVVWTIPEQGII